MGGNAVIIKKLSIFAILAALLISIFPAAMSASASNDLTDTGNRAFDDLTRCISTKKVLDVYYLIDESGSLKYTDPKDDRADILAASLSALGDFQSDIKVNYAVTFFGDGTDKWAPWSQVSKSTISAKSAALRNEIRKPSRKKDWNTDWLAGLQQAKNDLSAQAGVSHGCQALIWLTDGGIDLQQGNSYSAPHTHDEDRTNQAVSTLCNDVMPALRKNQVSVFGVLLKNDAGIDSMPADQRENTLNGMPHLYPLVEGKSDGALDGTTEDHRTCGYPIPTNQPAGAVLIAQDPVQLALQFMVLTAATQGGIERNLPAGNPTHFKIDKGVRRFELVTTSKLWTLTGPNGLSYASGSDGVDVSQSGLISTISVNIGTPEFGVWHFAFTNGKQNKLFLFSGLDVQINKSGLVADEVGTLSGKIISQSDLQPVDMSAYKPSDIRIEEILRSGASDSVDKLKPKNTGEFSLSKFKPVGTASKIELRITMSLTTIGGTKLKDISVTRVIDVPDRSHYPTLESAPIQISDLEDKKIGKGKFRILPPEVGTGRVCFDNSEGNGVTVSSDEFKDQRFFQFKITGLGSDGCIQVSKKPVTINIEAKTDKPGEAAVTANLPMTSFSDSEIDGKIRDDIPIELKTTLYKKFEWQIKVLLFILGLLLPWLFSYLFNKALTKITFGTNIQRAVLPVMVHSTRGVTAVDGGILQVKPEDFKFISEQEPTISYKDQLGEMRARTPKNLFQAPWFEFESNSGFRAVTMLPVPPNLKKRFSTGQISPMKGNVNNFWALLVSNSDLTDPRNVSAIPATLLIFKKNKLSQPNQHIDVVMNATQTPGIWSAIAALPKLTEVPIEKKRKRTTSKHEASEEVIAPPPPPPPPPGMVPPPPNF